MIVKIKNRCIFPGEFHLSKSMGKLIPVLYDSLDFFSSLKEKNIIPVISVLVTGNKTIKRLNNDFRGINQATDVLSFPALENDGEIIKDISQFQVHFLYSRENSGEADRDKGYGFNEKSLYIDSSNELEIGDIVISYPTARKQAKEIGNSLIEEMIFLFVHSVLHLLGYDHIEKDDEAEMILKQREIMDKFNG